MLSIVAFVSEWMNSETYQCEEEKLLLDLELMQSAEKLSWSELETIRENWQGQGQHPELGKCSQNSSKSFGVPKILETKAL